MYIVCSIYYLYYQTIYILQLLHIYQLYIYILYLYSIYYIVVVVYIYYRGMSSSRHFRQGGGHGCGTWGSRVWNIEIKGVEQHVYASTGTPARPGGRGWWGQRDPLSVDRPRGHPTAAAAESPGRGPTCLAAPSAPGTPRCQPSGPPSASQGPRRQERRERGQHLMMPAPHCPLCGDRFS